MKNFEIELRLRGFSQRTIKTYLYYNQDFMKLIGKPVRRVNSRDIKRYLTYLVFEKGVEPATLNLAISALKAYYERFLKRKLFHYIERAKLPKSLPVVLSKQEVKEMIDTTKNLKHKLLVELLYSSGLRVSEAVKIKILDLDLKQRIVWVRKGKGSKDRIAILSHCFVKDVVLYLEKRKDSNQYLFKRFDDHITIRATQEIVRKAARKAGIRKRVTPHTLRHSFATHLLENGTNIRYIQKLLGHSRLQTTQIYTHVAASDIKNIQSPLDS